MLAPASTPLTTIAGGIGYVCALSDIGELYCQGAWSEGVYGDDNPAVVLGMTPVSGAATTADIAANDDLTCVIDGADSQVHCAGRSTFAADGRSDTPRASLDPTSFTDTFTAISVSGKSTCGISATTSYITCWGRDQFGQLGDGGGTGGQTTSPTQITQSETYATITSGGDHHCGVRDDGRAYCWGLNNRGQLGDGTRTTRNAPVEVPRHTTGTVFLTTHDWTSIDSHLAHTCGIAANGDALCWGYNVAGQLGDNSTTERTSPVVVRGLHSWQQLSTGNSTTCGLRTDQTLYCWGWDGDGGAAGGAGTTSLPVEVGGGRSFTDVTVGDFHGCAIEDVTFDLYCWGNNEFGQLGTGDRTNRPTPTLVDSSRDWSDVEAGSWHTCASDVSGAAHCTGANIWGEAATGTHHRTLTPARAANGT